LKWRDNGFHLQEVDDFEGLNCLTPPTLKRSKKFNLTTQLPILYKNVIMKPATLILLLCISITSYGQSLPDFSFLTSEGIELNKASLKQGMPVIVIYFDPYLETCIKQAETIKKSMGKLPIRSYG
jgi:hypothetical protein